MNKNSCKDKACFNCPRSSLCSEEKTKTHYVFCQFDTRFLYRDYQKTLADQYYEKQWESKQKDGYYKPKEYWEIPTWITEIDGILENAGHTSELKILDSIDGKRFKVYNTSDSKRHNVHLFSVLDINKQYVRQIAKDNPDSIFLCGGYIAEPFKYFKDCPNVTWCTSIANFCGIMGFEYSYEVSYRLFKDTKCIPRLTMSTGCKHNCKFCCVDRELKEYSVRDILKQIDAMINLDFKLVYINDKTFGQCKNYKSLDDIRREIKAYNLAFDGFIIQTTAAKCKDLTFCKELKSLGVKVVEIGVETYNDQWLKEYRKPHSCKMIDNAMVNLFSEGLKIIPNILIGLIGENLESYRNTINFLEYWNLDIYSLNIYNLAIYADTDLAKETNANSSDTDEMLAQKSYHTDRDKINIDIFYSEVFKLGIEILDQ